jgi:hypothetical protein
MMPARRGVAGVGTMRPVWFRPGTAATMRLRISTTSNCTWAIQQGMRRMRPMFFEEPVLRREEAAADEIPAFDTGERHGEVTANCPAWRRGLRR